MPYNVLHQNHAIEGALKRIQESVYTAVSDLNMTAYVTEEPVPYANRTEGRQITPKKGETWGQLWDCAWFHFTGQVPEELRGKKVVLLIDISGELCIFDKEGTPVRGLTNVSSEFNPVLGNPGKRVVPVADPAAGGEIIDLWADAGCNDLFGNYRDSGTVQIADIAVCNEEMRQLFYDYSVLHRLMQQVPETDARHHSIRFCLFEAAQQLWAYTEEEAAKARAVLKPELEKQGGDPSLRLTAIGHAHIDLGWLWPIRETIRKGARTFSTALANMEQYPDYVFGASQPQLYQWMKDYYPGLYKKIAPRVQEGRWEAQGAMWVEADTNVSGGEALVRQILYGKRFFRQEFGKEMEVLWLPDVFGYNAALPQILKKSKVDYFLTIKLSWSQHNRFPHHTFRWRGIDHSEVLVHMPPEGEYNSAADPRAIRLIETSYQDKGVSDEAMILFGIGDGGGGPGEEHLERLQREKNLAGQAPVQQGLSVDFFHRLEEKRDRYAVYTGELYLEKHQGTYTTQARNKWYNRKMEYALRELEFAAVASGSAYPSELLERTWKEVLLYQFHDILPGSSIKRVYDESLARYAAMYQEITEATRGIYGGEAAVVNSLSWERTEWIRHADKWYKVTVPPMGAAALTDGQPAERAEAKQAGRLENDLICVTVDESGAITSVWDKRLQQEMLEQPSNRFAVYYDDGDAWDFNETYRSRAPQYFTLTQTEAYTDGPQQKLVQHYTYGDSTLRQEISVIEGSPLVRCDVTVDWKERGRMLRTAFYTNIVTDEVTCDIQFGNIKRPTHRNTTWDMAKYEICAHKYLDLSDQTHGVALLNDCKYGFCVQDSMLDINLLRSPSHPGKEADLAVHHIAYALYPHTGDAVAAKVLQQAYAFNLPMQLSASAMPSFVTVDNPNVVIEAVKKAEDSEAVIVRLYECTGGEQTAKIAFRHPVKEAYLVNMLEEEPVPVDLSELRFRPFEIHTLKVLF